MSDFHYSHPRPAVTVDTVVLDLYDDDRSPQVLLVKRKNEPFKGMWALPGGFLDMNEELTDGASRELLEETGIDFPPDNLKLVTVAGNCNRDPRGRIISVVYTAVVDRFEFTLRAGDDAEDASWFEVKSMPCLAADHERLVHQALEIAYD